MKKKYPLLVTDISKSGVRGKSGSDLPVQYRNWESVSAKVELNQTRWDKPIRRVNHVGYPPFDMFSEWLMDFASISAHALGRKDWQNFRNIVLIHIGDCPLECWYCFNDAWCKSSKIKSGEKIDVDDWIKEFLEFRKKYKGSFGNEYNVLRISGGEPWWAPEFILDFATSFKKQNEKLPNEDKIFLWIDSNLVPFKNKLTSMHKDALNKLQEISQYVAFHVCLHGGSDESLKKFAKDGTVLTFENLIDGLKRLSKFKLNIFPRINPSGITPEESDNIFRALYKINIDLPLKTYLGILELKYPPVKERIKELNTITNLYPPNGVIYQWNRLLEDTYGVGYAKIPRFLVNKEEGKLETKTQSEKHWDSVFVSVKGWSKEPYALKLLELLAMPNSAEIYIEYENKHVEPNLVAHISNSPEFYIGKRVLFVIAIASSSNIPKIIPLRWGIIKKIKTEDINENQSLSFVAAVNNFAGDFYDLFLEQKDEFDSEELGLKLASYIGKSKLPLTDKVSGHYFQNISLEFNNNSTPVEKSTFKNTIQEICSHSYLPAQDDVYYHIKSIKSIRHSELSNDKLFNNERLTIKEGDEIEIVVESCNPNMGTDGYPNIQDTELVMSSTKKDEIKIQPEKIKLSKYGQSVIHIQFPRIGSFDGILFFKPQSNNKRMAELNINFQVTLNS